jgi:NADH-quinone oxidoreductase subunit E
MSAAMSNKSRIDLIPQNVREEIDRWIAKYPPEQKRAAVMAALRLVQEAHGNWISTELIEAVAEYLEMPPIAVHEVATFYSMYNLKPVGRHAVCVCTNISCMLCGSDSVVEHLKKKLGVSFGETTADGRFTLREVECLGACVGAPMMQVGRTYYEYLTPEKVDQILEQYE